MFSCFYLAPANFGACSYLLAACKIDDHLRLLIANETSPFLMVGCMANFL